MAEITLTNHAKIRATEREIDIHELKKVAKNGEVTKIDFNGTIVKKGICANGRSLIVVCVKTEARIVIKTAYYEN